MSSHPSPRSSTSLTSLTSSCLGLATALTLVTACSTVSGETDDLVDAGTPGKEDSVDDGGETGDCPLNPGTEPQKQALFTDPANKPDLTIEDEFRRLVRSAVPGSTIRISIYAFSRNTIADEVIAAGARGVDVKLVLDGLNRFENSAGEIVPFGAVQKMRDALGVANVVICSDDEEIVALEGGCLSSGINHNKFAVFSELCDGSKNVVFQSSSNFSASQNDVQQNAVIMRDDPGLYDGYLAYWIAEAAKVKIPNYFQEVDGAGTRAWFFPRQRTGTATQEPSTDVIQGILDNVDCVGGTRVRVAMAFFNDSRDYLVDSLARLKGAGCDVKILSSTDITSDGVKAKIRSAFTTDEARFPEHLHSKYLFVDGGYVNTQRKLVWTGSHNWVYGSIRLNEETILRVDDATVFAGFDENWKTIWATSTP